MRYFRPILQSDPASSTNAVSLAGGSIWFETLEVLERGKPSQQISVRDIAENVLEMFIKTRMPIAGLSMDQTRIMGVLNVTPDSFSDGGDHFDVSDAITRGQEMIAEGADIVDIGGESTRPGANFVENNDEIARVLPVVEALNGKRVLSIDTRKADVASVAIAGGAQIFNDVSALSFDDNSVKTATDTDAAICLMHASGDPKTMQDNPHYDNVLLDVYDYLEARVKICEAAGISRDKIMIDPGIGFGKTTAHNLLLLRKISIFHGLGCPILLGVSRKRFIGELGKAQNPADRMPGSVAVALAAVQQGVQVLRVHDVWETRQALNLWQAVNEGSE